MATQTPNYGLTKPDASDFYDIQIQNDNMDIIDPQLKDISDRAVLRGRAAYYTPGTYSLTIPAGVRKIFVTAAAGGGGGGNHPTADYSTCAGGGGGACIIGQAYTVTPGSVLSITVGAGGVGAGKQNVTAATAGGNTIIGSLVTLIGGGAASSNTPGTAGGSNAGNGGTGNQGGGGGGGGGSYGKGGDGGANNSTNSSPGNNGQDGYSHGGAGGTGSNIKPPQNGLLGGGGGGSGRTNYHPGANGGNGFVVIEW